MTTPASCLPGQLNSLCLLPAVFLLTLLSVFIPPASAQNNNIPTELQQWIPWVLYEQEEKLCTLETAGTGQRHCIWPSALDLDVRENGAVFKQNVLIESKSLVFLPGKAPYWPENVQDNKKNILVTEKNGQPAIWLSPGEHQLSGSFSWQTLPDQLFVPPAIGLIQLTLNGEKMTHLQLDQSGQLWFNKEEEKQKSKEDALKIQVFRKISDAIPLQQQLRILLTVSGTPREITLGVISSNEFVPLSLHSPLPIRLDQKGRLQLQVRPGQWQVELTLRNTLPISPTTISSGVIEGPWPDHEIWVFAADPHLRQVEISGLLPVDPSRTSLPEDWKSLSAFMQKGNEKMVLTEKTRGTSNPTPNRLEINRKIWLDESGTGITLFDTITGTMSEGWRLNADPRQNLGRVDVAGSARLITKLPGSEKTGVEVRQGTLQLNAESRIEKKVKSGQLTIPALGWDHSFQKLSAELHLPPGWKLLTASGVDRVPTWLNNWTLLDIFLLLIISLATSKILGLGWGSVAFFTLFLTYHQPGSPRFFWLPLLALMAIQKLITAKQGERILRAGILAILTIIIIGAVPFMINEIRTGIYPQLAYGKYHTIVPYHDLQEDGDQYNSAPAMKSEAAESMEKPLVEPLSKGKRLYISSVTAPPPQAIQIDPQALIQTGPGLPIWNWQKIPMTWNGPVRSDQEIHFVFLSPFVNMVIAFIRVILLGLLIIGFLRSCLRKGKNTRPAVQVSSLFTMLLFFLCAYSFVMPSAAKAEIPPQEILQELQERLLAPPKCGTNCASITFCQIHVENNLLQIELQINAINQTAIPLPGKNRFFDQIILNNQPADILRVSENGFTLIRLQPGTHQVLLNKDLQGMNKTSLQFPMAPQQGKSTLQGWTMVGLRENGALDKQITLNKIDQNAINNREEDKDDLNTIHIPDFVCIERVLHMGLTWNIETTVIRRSPESVITLDIPLLPGEHVITDNLLIADNKIRVNMGTEQQRFTWHSAMDSVDTVTLSAAKTSSWTEHWLLDIGPIWHVLTRGLPEIHQTNPAGRRYPEYRPYPGESLQLLISRPAGISGQIVTITKSELAVKQGIRASDVTLSLSLTASRGLPHSITLPPDIVLQKCIINNKEFPLQLENHRLILPVQPGKQDVQISWRREGTIPFRFLTEAVDLGMSSVNHAISVDLPASRWILMTGGPRIGPAVLFWGELLVFIFFAILLGRIRFTPLSTLQWLLLSLGLSQVPAFLAAVVVIWLLLLGLRRKKGAGITQPAAFNCMQVFLLLLTLAALGVLFFAIQQGLLGDPDMQISGNGSYNHSLHWYQDRNPSLLPTAWVVSVPLLAYRISMLLWALWLAVALLGWLRWGWDCISETTVWKKTVRKPKKKGILPVKPAGRKKTDMGQKTTQTTTGKAVKKVSTQPVGSITPAKLEKEEK